MAVFLLVRTAFCGILNTGGEGVPIGLMRGSTVIAATPSFSPTLVQLFIPLGVRVVVVDITTWSSGDQIQYPPDNEPSVLLRNFQDFEPQITAVHDSTMLIT